MKITSKKIIAGLGIIVVIALAFFFNTLVKEAKAKTQGCDYKKYSSYVNLDTTNPWKNTTTIKLFVYERPHGIDDFEGKYNVIDNDTVNLPAAKQIITLSEKQEEDLKKELYNSINESDFGIANDCIYNPHHCIVFYDKKEKPVGFIEVCLECHQIHTENVWLPAMCPDVFDRLRGYFKEVGVKFYLETCEGK